MDNEISLSLLNAFEKENINYQLVPPHIHRRNAAERTINTWKNHFIAGLSSIHPEFPLLEWDRLTEQGMMTQIFLRNTRTNPKLSSWEYIFGRYDYRATPMAPPGIKMVIHEKPSQRGSLDPLGIVGFYIGPAMMHYRSVKCCIPSTRAERVTDTITFLPHKTPVPQVSPAELIRHALEKIIKLATSPPKNLPFLPEANDTHQAVKDIAKIFSNLKLETEQSSLSNTQKLINFYKQNIPNK